MKHIRSRRLFAQCCLFLFWESNTIIEFIFLFFASACACGKQILSSECKRDKSVRKEIIWILRDRKEVRREEKRCEKSKCSAQHKIHLRVKANKNKCLPTPGQTILSWMREDDNDYEHIYALTIIHTCSVLGSGRIWAFLGVLTL